MFFFPSLFSFLFYFGVGIVRVEFAEFFQTKFSQQGRAEPIQLDSIRLNSTQIDRRRRATNQQSHTHNKTNLHAHTHTHTHIGIRIQLVALYHSIATLCFVAELSGDVVNFTLILLAASIKEEILPTAASACLA